jgi:hypothetical protein
LEIGGSLTKTFDQKQVPGRVQDKFLGALKAHDPSAQGNALGFM